MCYFVSISGGAGGPDSNPKLSSELKKRMGKDADALIDLHIADLLPGETKPTIRQTSSYKLTPQDVTKLTAKVMGVLRK